MSPRWMGLSMEFFHYTKEKIHTNWPINVFTCYTVLTPWLFLEILENWLNKEKKLITSSVIQKRSNTKRTKISLKRIRSSLFNSLQSCTYKYTFLLHTQWFQFRLIQSNIHIIHRLLFPGKEDDKDFLSWFLALPNGL